ncbi:hypothetical protein [Cytobacillus purgationiresistens]|uniref:DUF1700 domain-containing protein n=1 Tax=Cytobacillus purgationiresistens TaxID=863449 RepID=A0ABU0AP74_9BACI|nr:hypothetical protein [Cytobacillus purgationiresistens]MDQ0272993.1 hypothetical protein [Cytobacillus purgationiresistens]
MKSELTAYEKQYVSQILDILKTSGVSPSYREDAKVQLIEHINEARIQNEDFRDDLGSPEDFALHFMDTAIAKEDQKSLKMNNSNHQAYKKELPIKGTLLFLILSGVYYFLFQFSSVLLFTPVLAPDYGFAFHLFKVSNYLWWNLLVILINVLIAFGLSGLTLKLFSKKYRIS